MKLRDIAYEILTLLRSGLISDDERIDLRLFEELIHQYRLEYVKELNQRTKTIPESFVQTSNVELTLTTRTTYKSLESNDLVPRISIGRYGAMIVGLYSPYVDEPSFTLVNRNQLKYCGNGKFNDKAIYVSYQGNRIVFKTKNAAYNSISDVDVTAVFEKPTDVPEFDEDLDDYPIDLDCVNYIKERFRDNDIKLILGQFSDEVNDADGEIEENGR